MGNPRQRRRARSSAHKTIKHSRHAKRNLRKMKPIQGPKALQEAWDPKKTLRQNYDAMGLVGSLKPADSGGAEIPLPIMLPKNSQEAGSSMRTTSTMAKEAPVPLQYGKIIRDAEGNVTGVEIINEEKEDDEDDMSADRVNGKGGRKTELLDTLEKLAESARPVPRFASDGEMASLKKLIEKHGHDFEAMAKDRRLNTWQRTSGQLERACRKSGLV